MWTVVSWSGGFGVEWRFREWSGGFWSEGLWTVVSWSGGLGNGVEVFWSGVFCGL